MVVKTIYFSVIITALILRSLISGIWLLSVLDLIYREVIGFHVIKSISYTSSLHPSAKMWLAEISAIWYEYQFGEKNKLNSGNESTRSESIINYNLSLNNHFFNLLL